MTETDTETEPDTETAPPHATEISGDDTPRVYVIAEHGNHYVHHRRDDDAAIVDVVEINGQSVRFDSGTMAFDGTFETRVDTEAYEGMEFHTHVAELDVTTPADDGTNGGDA